jgi:hypothetical protein
MEAGRQGGREAERQRYIWVSRLIRIIVSVITGVNKL